MSTKKVSIVIPVYFNSGSLDQLFVELEKLMEQFKTKHSLGSEIVCVDDGSKDDSLAKLLAFKTKHEDIVTVVKHSKNFGAFNAIATGFKHASGDAVVTLSADLQDPPEQVGLMVDKWMEGNKFVVSSRATRDDPALSKFLASMYYKALNFFVIGDFPSGGYDLMLMDKEFMPLINNLNGSHNCMVYAYSLGIKPAILYYHRRKREHGFSGWTFAKKVNLFIDTITGFSVKPLRYISLIGIFVSLAFLLYGIFSIFYALTANVKVPGYATLVVLISFSTATVLMTLSIIGEYIWRIFDIANNKPVTVVEEVF
jgi:glycosyltransferase involved in cell wall biosynthesis